MRNLKHLNARRERMTLESLCLTGTYTVADLKAAAAESENGEQLLDRIRELGLDVLYMKVCRETPRFARICLRDWMGSVEFIEARKD